jgi:hypothetical protein
MHKKIVNKPKKANINRNIVRRLREYRREAWEELSLIFEMLKGLRQISCENRKNHVKKHPSLFSGVFSGCSFQTRVAGK